MSAALPPAREEAPEIELLIQALDPATLPQWKANLLLVLMSIATDSGMTT